MALWVCPVVAPGVGSRGRRRRCRWEVAARVRSPPTSSSMHQTNCCPPELQSVAALGFRQRTGSSSPLPTSTEAAGTVPNGLGPTPLSFHRPAVAPLKRFLHGDKRFYARPTTFFGDGNPTPHIKFANLFTFPPELLHLASSIHLPSSHHTLIASLIPPPNRKNGQDQGRQDQQQQEGQGRARRREGRRQGSEGRR